MINKTNINLSDNVSKGFTPLNLPRVNKSYVIHHPYPITLAYAWSFGALAGILLAMHNIPSIELALNSVVEIMRDVKNGCSIGYSNANGAYMFFTVIYANMCRGVYNCSYMKPRKPEGAVNTLPVTGLGVVLPVILDEVGQQGLEPEEYFVSSEPSLSLGEVANVASALTSFVETTIEFAAQITPADQGLNQALGGLITRFRRHTDEVEEWLPVGANLGGVVDALPAEFRDLFARAMAVNGPIRSHGVLPVEFQELFAGATELEESMRVHLNSVEEFRGQSQLEVLPLNLGAFPSLPGYVGPLPHSIPPELPGQGLGLLSRAIEAVEIIAYNLIENDPSIAPDDDESGPTDHLFADALGTLTESAVSWWAETLPFQGLLGTLHAQARDLLNIHGEATSAALPNVFDEATSAGLAAFLAPLLHENAVLAATLAPALQENASLLAHLTPMFDVQGFINLAELPVLNVPEIPDPMELLDESRDTDPQASESLKRKR
jgi:hypothetical protein